MFGQRSLSAPHATGLAHLSYNCPGLHGPGAAKQDITKSCFEAVLGSQLPVLRIPPFQRAYCWDESLAAGWWRDAQKGSHRTGQTIFCQVSNAQSDRELWIVDGQQRLTTTCLLVAAIRDAALQLPATAGNAIVASCDAALFRNSGKVAMLRALPDGDRPPLATNLLPTLRDRLTFEQLMLGNLGAKPHGNSPLFRVKRTFDNAVMGRSESQLAADLRNALQGMTFMAVTIVDPPHGLAQQVYQWAQERSMAMDASLQLRISEGNGHGRWLAVSDLVRNLILAPLLDRSATDAEEVVRLLWLPLETQFDSPLDFDKFLMRFVCAHPRAPESSAARAFNAAADEAEALTPKSELAKKWRLYGAVLSEYEVVLADCDENMRMVVFVQTLTKFASFGRKDGPGSEICLLPAHPAPKVAVRCA